MGAKKDLRRLTEQRQDGIRELGELAVEMYARKEIDIEALRDRAGELAQVDERIRDLEARLRVATA